MKTPTKVPPAAVYITASDIQRELAVSRASAYSIMKQLPHIRAGRIVRAKRSDFDLWLAARKVPAIPARWSANPPAVQVQARVRMLVAKAKKAASEPPIRLTRRRPQAANPSPPASRE